MKPRVLLIAVLVLVIVGIAAAFLFRRGAPGGAAERRQPPVLLIGMDALDWNEVDPLVAAGKLPNFDRMIRAGVRADIRTLIPLMESPAIWTTIATGRFPETHGVTGFMRGNEASTLSNAETRKVKAVWNILGSAGLRVGVVGWLVTWPCEAVNGFMVSDYLQYDFDQAARASGRTYPEALYDEVAPLVINRRVVTVDSLRWLVDVTTADLEDPGIMEGIEAMKWIYAADETFARIGLELWKRERPDFMTVYMRGPDAMSHKFWYDRPYPGELYRGRPQFSHAIGSYYQYMDRVLGRFLDAAGPGTDVIVLSDHGYKGSTVLADGTVILGTGSHRELGVLVASGPSFRSGATGSEVAVEDVTPTLLYMFGLPLARDMDGEPMWTLFPADAGRRRAPHFVPSYETGEASARPTVDASPVDRELIERLKSLGYLK